MFTPFRMRDASRTLPFNKVTIDSPKACSGKVDLDDREEDHPVADEIIQNLDTMSVIEKSVTAKSLMT